MPALPGLPPFAPVSVRLLDILSRENAVVEQVAGLLQIDAAFVAEVLRLADTRIFGFERQIRALAHAVACLGTRRLEALAAVVGQPQPAVANASVRGYWRHDVASGFVAAALAEARGMASCHAQAVEMLRNSSLFHSPCAAPPECGVVESPDDTLEAAGVDSEMSCCSVACERLRELPQTVCEAFRADPARLARVLEKSNSVINN